MTAFGLLRDARVLLGALALGAAGAVGVASALDPLLGLSLALAALAVPLAVLRPSFVAPVLVITIFGESLTLGGVPAGRLAAPLAMLALLSHLAMSGDRPGAGGSVARWSSAFVCLAGASLAWSASPSGTASGLLTLAGALAYMGVVALTVRSARELDRLLWTVAGCAAALGVWWSWSFLSGIDRFTNPAGDPNFAAVHQVVALPLLLAFSSSRHAALQRAVLYVVLALAAVSVLATLSRGGLITLLLAGLLVAIVPARLFFRSRAHKLTVLTVVVLALGASAPAVWDQLRDRFQGERSRVGIWQAAWHGYVTHPLAGIGYGAFPRASYELMRTTPGVDLSAHTDEALAEGRFVHNTYLEVLVELGTAGFVVFAGLLLAVFRLLVSSARAAARAHLHDLRALTGATAVSLASFLCASLFLSASGRRMLWLLFGLAIALAAMVKRSLPGEVS